MVTISSGSLLIRHKVSALITSYVQNVFRIIFHVLHL